VDSGAAGSAAEHCAGVRVSAGASSPAVFGNRAVADIKEAHVRRWRAELLDSGVSPASVAKAYRLMKAIMNTAVDDGIMRRNPCRVRGAGQDRSPKRPVLTVSQVVALGETVPERYRALVLLAAFGSLRWGELAALRRCDVEAGLGTVRVERSLTEPAGGGYLFGPPKSAAGRRVVVCALGDQARASRASGDFHRERARCAHVHHPRQGRLCEMGISGAGCGLLP